MSLFPYLAAYVAFRRRVLPVGENDITVDFPELGGVYHSRDRVYPLYGGYYTLLERDTEIRGFFDGLSR